MGLMGSIQHDLLSEGFNLESDGRFLKKSPIDETEFMVSVKIVNTLIYISISQGGVNGYKQLVSGFNILSPGEIKYLLFRLVSYQGFFLQFRINSFNY